MSTEPPDASAADPRFAVVVPVKPPAVGKSRLGLDDRARHDLASAFALDTVRAALAADLVAQVLVVTDDARFAADLLRLGVDAVPDGVSLDLNATLGQGAAEAARRWPDLLPVALCADLPALDPVDLDDALRAVAGSVAGGSAAYVADTQGVGTTLYAAPHPVFDPRFGLASAQVHAARGAEPVDGPLLTLRRDVDDLDDLVQALRYGVGPRTAVVARRLGLD